MTSETHVAIEAVWRIEAARLIGGLARIVRDVGIAEELAQDALVAALEQWPEAGIPRNPGAWLMGTAKHRAIDLLRRRTVLDRKHEELGRELAIAQAVTVAAFETATDDDVGDDLLRLVFTACHPVLSRDSRVALTLRLLGGLTTDEIARAFLVPEPTIAQRIVRAKRTLTEAHVPFEVPRGDALAPRLASVLEVVYLIFNEGYSATAGDDWMRPGLCDEALRLGRMLAELAPAEPEVHGLVALMEIQASRVGGAARAGRRARPAARPGSARAGISSSSDAAWRPWSVPSGWAAPWGRTRSRRPSRPVTRGHGRPRRPTGCGWRPCTTRWRQVAPSPIVELNRAVAVGMAFGPAAGLEVVDGLRGRPVAEGLSPAAGRARRPAGETRS